jgi:hypothetical protein
MRGQNLGLLPNLVLFLITVESSLGTVFSLVLFNHRELFVSTTARIVKLESQLSNGKGILIVFMWWLSWENQYYFYFRSG